MERNNFFKRFGNGRNTTADLISSIHVNYHFYLIGELSQLSDDSHIENTNKYSFYGEISHLSINPHQIPLIQYLYENEKASQDEVADFLFLSKGTVAKILRRLEDDGIIEREVNQENRRKNDVVLSEKGKEIAIKIEKIDEKWESQIYKDLTKEEIEKGEEIIKKMVKNSEEIINNENYEIWDKRREKFKDLHEKYGMDGPRGESPYNHPQGSHPLHHPFSRFRGRF